MLLCESPHPPRDSSKSPLNSYSTSSRSKNERPITKMCHWVRRIMVCETYTHNIPRRGSRVKAECCHSFLPLCPRNNPTTRQQCIVTSHSDPRIAMSATDADTSSASASYPNFGARSGQRRTERGCASAEITVGGAASHRFILIPLVSDSGERSAFVRVSQHLTSRQLGRR